MNKVSLKDVPIYEQDVFQRAGIEILDCCLKLLLAKDLKMVLLPEGRGVGRLLNLLQWDVGEALEYVDGDGPLADQVIHYGMHHLVDDLIGHDGAEKMLLAETIASAADFYLLGQLIRSGEECDFLLDMVESLGSYYEQYSNEDCLEALFERCAADPFATFAQVVLFLYETVEPLLYLEDPQAVTRGLLAVQDNELYPVLHHYNIGNWVLTLRARFPQRGAEWNGKDLLDKWFASETSFLALLP